MGGLHKRSGSAPLFASGWGRGGGGWKGKGRLEGEGEGLGFYIIDNPPGKRGRPASLVKPIPVMKLVLK